MNGQGADWFFSTAKTLKACRHCGKRAGFREDTIVDYDEESDADREFTGRTCNWCGEFNGEIEE